MDMVTDGGGGGGFNPEDEATRRALLHMSKVRMCVIGSQNTLNGDASGNSIDSHPNFERLSDLNINFELF